MISELYAVIVEWMVATGAKDIHAQPGLWRGETDEWSVEMNPQKEEVDGIPILHIRLSHKTYLAFGIVGPDGGLITGPGEEAVTAHFKAATEALQEGAAHG